MQFTAPALLALASSASAIALPQTTEDFPNTSAPGPGETFGTNVLGSGDFHQDYLTASNGKIFVGGAQDPKCEGGARQDMASFNLYSDRRLFLHKAGNPPQQIYTDLSTDGNGTVGYFSVGKNQPPRYASVSGFQIDDQGYLKYEGLNPRACPAGESGKWSVWFTLSDKPGGREGCVDISIHTYKAPARVACEYSELPADQQQYAETYGI